MTAIEIILVVLEWLAGWFGFGLVPVDVAEAVSDERWYRMGREE